MKVGNQGLKKLKKNSLFLTLLIAYQNLSLPLLKSLQPALGNGKPAVSLMKFFILKTSPLKKMLYSKLGR